MNSCVFWFGEVVLICNSLLSFGHLLKQILLLFIVHMKSYMNFQTDEMQLIQSLWITTNHLMGCHIRHFINAAEEGRD